MKILSKKDLILTSLMLFSLFFGAGNLIFPPFLGQSAGSSTWLAMGGFLISAVGFPVLGVVAVAKAGGLHSLAKRVHPYFAIIFTILIYLAIGPFLGIPRAGSLPFEMAVAPFLSKNLASTPLTLFIYTLCFFSISYWLCLAPSKLVDRFGKILTPLLLILISSIFICSLFHPIGNYGAPTGEYAKSSFFKGFLDGYMTMDTIAALNFGIVISLTIKSKGITEKKSIISNSIRSGIIAGFFLMIIYIMLAHLGACSGGKFGATSNGAQTLTNVVFYLFGKPGAILLALIFTLACLTTCVGLITSCSQYFVTLNERISYVTWVRIISISSMILANMGLTKILAVSVPILNAIYPIAIVLIVLSLANDLFNSNSSVYICSILFTSLVSILDSLNQSIMHVSVITKLFSYLPLYSKGLGWLIPSILGIVIGLLYSFSKNIILNKDLNLS